MLNARAAVAAFLHEERAATAVEYALMLALIAAICAVAVTSLGNTVNDNFVAFEASW